MATAAKPATLEQSKAAAAALLKFWRTAVRSRKTAASPDYTHGQKQEVLHAEAARVGLNHDTLKKAWTAAEMFSHEQVDELAELVIECQARFGPSHLTRLLAAPSPAVRWKLARQAIRGRWGVAKLGRAVQAANGERRARVGRKPAIPNEGPELLLALDAQADKLVRWCELAEGRLPERVREAVRRATAAVGEVRRRIAAELEE